MFIFNNHTVVENIGVSESPCILEQFYQYFGALGLSRDCQMLYSVTMLNFGV